MARVVSDGFLTVARQYFGSLPKGVNEAAKCAYENRGDLAAAATCLALAIELQLKAMAIACGMTPLRKHDLASLFLELPAELRELIERSYASVIPKVREEDLGSIELWITTTAYPPTKEEVASLSKHHKESTTALELLQKEQSAFQNWRYVYEPDMPSGVSLVKIEYGRLAALAKVLQSCTVAVVRG